MPEQAQPETPDAELPQDPGVPGARPAPPPEKDGSLEKPESPEDPTGIDEPGSERMPPPNH